MARGRDSDTEWSFLAPLSSYKIPTEKDGQIWQGAFQQFRMHREADDWRVRRAGSRGKQRELTCSVMAAAAATGARVPESKQCVPAPPALPLRSEALFIAVKPHLVAIH